MRPNLVLRSLLHLYLIRGLKESPIAGSFDFGSYSGFDSSVKSDKITDDFIRVMSV